MAPHIFRKPGARERATIEKIVERKISVSSARAMELEALRERVQSSSFSERADRFNIIVVHITLPVNSTSTPGGGGGGGEGASSSSVDAKVPLLLEQATTEEEETGLVMSLVGEVQRDESFNVGVFKLPEDGWKEFKQRLGPKTEVKPDAVIMTLSGDALSDMAKTVMAASMLQSLPVLAFQTPRCAESVGEEAFAYTGRTWPVFRDLKALAEYVSGELLGILRLREALSAEVRERVQQYKQINPFLHFTKRAAVALIPFAVMAVNFAGLMRLCARMMHTSGMLDDRESKKAALMLGSITAGKVALVDSLGDIYQFAICTTVLADFATAATFELALSSLSIADVFLLGSVSVVTGAISACGAYYTRPELVDTIAGFLANMQLIYLVNPEMRRAKQSEGEEQEPAKLEASPADPSINSPSRAGGVLNSANAT